MRSNTNEVIEENEKRERVPFIVYYRLQYLQLGVVPTSPVYSAFTQPVCTFAAPRFSADCLYPFPRNWKRRALGKQRVLCHFIHLHHNLRFSQNFRVCGHLNLKSLLAFEGKES